MIITQNDPEEISANSILEKIEKAQENLPKDKRKKEYKEAVVALEELFAEYNSFTGFQSFPKHYIE